VVGGDGAAHLRRRAFHEIDAFLRRQVLQDEAQAGEAGRPLGEVALYKHGLAVEDVDIGIDILAMHQERHADLFHPFQHRHDPAIVCDAGSRIRRRVGGIELDPGEHALVEAALNLVRIGIIGEVAGHQRLELRAPRQRCQDAPAVGNGILRGGDRRDQIRHQDGATEIPRREWRHRLEHGAVAQMQVPVVRLADGEAGRHRGRNCRYPIGAAAAA